jgi:hypothetical protein
VPKPPLPEHIEHGLEPDITFPEPLQNEQFLFQCTLPFAHGPKVPIPPLPVQTGHVTEDPECELKVTW